MHRGTTTAATTVPSARFRGCAELREGTTTLGTVPRVAGARMVFCTTVPEEPRIIEDDVVLSTQHQSGRRCDHVVKIYDDDHDLVRGVGEFLAEGIVAGDAVIVVATPVHRDAFSRALAGSAADLVAPTAEGRYLAVDAAGLLAQFMVDGVPDPTRFRAVVGGLIERFGKRRVHIFGEMVAVLWDEGNVTAAIALEGLWNDLALSHNFSLYCAYAMTTFEASDLASVREVCDHHSDIVSPASYTQRPQARPERGAHTTVSEFFVPVPLAIRGARRFVESALLAWGETELLENAAVVASELATNAVRHARSPFRVSIARVDGIVTLVVHDGSADSAEPRRLNPDAEGGRGLALVAALCPSWGTEVVPDGKIVWAELASRV